MVHTGKPKSVLCYDLSFHLFTIMIFFGELFPFSAIAAVDLGLRFAVQLFKKIGTGIQMNK